MSKARDNSKELEQLQKEQQGAISLIDKQESEERINQAKREHDRKVQYGFEVANQFVSTLTTMAEATKADAITKKRIAQLGAIVSGAQAVVNAMIAPPPLDMIMAGLIGVQVAAQIAIIENTKYGEGGPIKGRSHSSGGVHIEAEGGEYIQRREAVDYYGVSAMEAINRRMIPKELFASIRGMNITFPGGTAASGGMVKAGASGVSVSMVNFVDPQLMNKYMKTTAGKKAMVNFISDNSYEVKQALSI
jgi:hypothetical protein